MANSNFGLKIGVEGEREFKKALNDINSQMKVLGSEMKVVEARFSSQDRSVEALTARNEVLNKNIEAQKEKIETLKKALENASSSFGENDKRTQAWAIQLNNAQADLIKLEKELHKNNDELKNAGNRMDDTGDAADDMGDDIEDAGDEAEESSHKFEGLGKVCKACAATIAAAFAAVGAAAVTAGKKLIEMTREGAAYADTVLTESTVTGIATDKLQEYMSPQSWSTSLSIRSRSRWPSRSSRCSRTRKAARTSLPPTIRSAFRCLTRKATSGTATKYTGRSSTRSARWRTRPSVTHWP